jgi:hypothetical protein
LNYERVEAIGAQAQGEKRKFRRKPRKRASSAFAQRLVASRGRETVYAYIAGELAHEKTCKERNL